MKSKAFIRVVLINLFAAICGFSAYSQNFPPLSITIHDAAASKGYYFLSPYTNTSPYIYEHAHLILDSLGRTVYYRAFENLSDPNPTIDFKLQPNGQISYFNIARKKFFLMDSTFTVVDSIGCIHGFDTDQHDLQILPDDHYLLFGTEIRVMNLSSYHWFGFAHTLPGATNAQVAGVVIQEFNEYKNLVWEWKSHDHYQFGDGDSVWYFNPNKVDWTHANAVEKDWDGNILLSLRHFNEITKIDHETGDIIWRLGGKMNEFQFPGDPVRFSGQHDIRRVSENTISLLDNGQYSVPQRCRAVEYTLDEDDKVATLTWSYNYDSTMYSLACGSHQHISNGNHLADFGFTNGIFPWMVVVKQDKSPVLEISYPQGYISYRAFNYPTLPWTLKQPVVECRKSGGEYYLDAEPGHSEYRWSTGDTTRSIIIADTGEYWVFVPYGTGYISSAHTFITDPVNPCTFVSTPSPCEAREAGIRCVPNPSAGQTRIYFTLPAPAYLRISLYNLTGTKKLTPAEGFFAGGEHSISLDVSALEPGLYIVSMTTDQHHAVTKLVVQK